MKVYAMERVLESGNDMGDEKLCYEDIEDFNEQYSHEKDGYTLDDIREETVVIEIPDTERFIIGVF